METETFIEPVIVLCNNVEQNRNLIVGMGIKPFNIVQYVSKVPDKHYVVINLNNGTFAFSDLRMRFFIDDGQLLEMSMLPNTEVRIAYTKHLYKEAAARTQVMQW